VSAPQTKISFQLAQQMQDVQMEIVQPAAAAQKLAPKLLSDSNLGSGSYEAALTTPIPANTPVQVNFSYHGGDKTAFVFHIGAEGSYADGNDIAWYPEFGPKINADGKIKVDGQGAVVGKATYIIPSDLTIMASGKETDGPKDSTKASFTYEIIHPSTFAFTLDKFKVLRSPGPIPVAIYLKEPKPNEAEMLKGIRGVVDELTSIYGNFPYPEFALVEVSDAAVQGAGFGGAGCPGFMISTTSFLDGGFNMAFFGHEIGHQWWGNEINHVTEDEGNDLLDEAMAQYGSLYCVQHLVGEKAAQRYRWIGYPGYVSSQCGQSYLRFAAAGVDMPIGKMHGADGSLYHELACEKGFLAFDQLRREIGDDAFHRALKQITSRYAFTAITWSQFKAEVGRSAHRDLLWFWAQWFERKGAPFLDLKWKQMGSSVAGVLLQGDPVYRLKVPVRVVYADGSSDTIRVPSNALDTAFTLKARGLVVDVEADPNFEILHYTPDSKRAAEAFIPFSKAFWLLFEGKREEGQKAMQDIVSNFAGPDSYGLEFTVRYRLAQQLYQGRKYAETLQQAEQALDCPSRDELLLPLCYQLITYAAQQVGDKAKAKWAAKACLGSEQALGQYTSVSKSAEKWLASH